jgi:hypothetical protein
MVHVEAVVVAMSGGTALCIWPAVGNCICSADGKCTPPNSPTDGNLHSEHIAGGTADVGG